MVFSPKTELVGNQNQPPVVPAATVMLVRDSAAGLEVFVLRRVPQMAFAAGMTVFPGGGVDPTDRDAIGWRGPECDWWATEFGIDRAAAAAVVVAVVRELFEETGVLLGDLAPGVDAEQARVQVADRQRTLGSVVTHIEVSGLRPWARWVTPPGNPRRYDTFFFVGALPSGGNPQVLTTEADHGQWITPAAALAAASAGELAMLPPTVAMLTDLAAFTSVAGLLSAPRDIHPVLPVIVSTKGEPIRVAVDGAEFQAFLGGTRPS